MAPEKMFRNWSRRTGEQAAGAKMCHVQSENEVAEPTAKPAAHSSRIFSDLLGLKIWQLGIGRGVTRRELNHFFWTKHEDNNWYIWNIHQIYHWCHLEIYNSWWYANNIKEGFYIWDWSTS
jgi:hypothetical protein